MGDPTDVIVTEITNPGEIVQRISNSLVLLSRVTVQSREGEVQRPTVNHEHYPKVAVPRLPIDIVVAFENRVRSSSPHGGGEPNQRRLATARPTIAIVREACG